MAKYLYLPRLRDDDVLLAGVRDGIGRLTWNPETFAYAERWDEQKKQYAGMQAGHALQVLLDGQSVSVKPDVAAKQLDTDREEREERERRQGGGATSATGGTPIAIIDGGADPTDPTPPPMPRRFHATVELSTLKVGSEAGRIAQEVIQHLSSRAGVTVKVTLDVEADIPEGAPQDLVRTITENCRTLRFQSYGFEEA